MLTIGIDPGPKMHGLVVWNGNEILSCGEFSTNDTIAYMEKVIKRTIDDQANGNRDIELINLACEMVACFGMPVGREIFETVMQTGILAYQFGTLRLIPRTDIKMHLCGTVRSKDANIRQALIDRVGPKGTRRNPGPTYGLTNHTWAALAVAITASEMHYTPKEWINVYSKWAV